MEKKTKKKLSRNAQRMIQIYGEDLCFKALELFGNGENITTYQVGRELGVKSNTAWAMINTAIELKNHSKNDESV